MPHPIEIRKLGPRWASLKAEVALIVQTYPAEGVNRVAFDEQCLQGINFYERDKIVEGLRKAKLIFTARQGDENRVFGFPNNKRLANPNADPKLNQFMAGVVGPMARLADLAEGGNDVSPEVRDSRRTAVLDVVGFVRRYVGRGGSLPKARERLWSAFHPNAMEIVARYERGLARDAALVEIAAPPPKPVRIAQDQDPQTRIIEVLKRAGPQGITKSDIHGGFKHPRPTQAQVDEWLDEIVLYEAARVETCRLSRMGRMGKRYFSMEYDAPDIVGGVLHLA